MEDSQLDSTTGYRDKNETVEIIQRACRIEARYPSVRLGFSERVPVHGRNKNDIDRDLD